MTVIPQAPGPDFVFTPPPSWGAPTGFDPRKGHVVDPAWPPPPDGWQFWTLPVVSPATRLGNGQNKIGKLRIVFGVTRCALPGLPAHRRLRRRSVEGCRLVLGGVQRYEVRGHRRLRLDSYLDSKEDGDARYKCLVPVG